MIFWEEIMWKIFHSGVILFENSQNG